MDKDELKKRLTKEQYRITQDSGTEAPFTGKYYKTKTEGMYKCVVCGEELFDSKTKFDSFSGWPSFYDFKEGAVEKSVDNSVGMERVEVHCKKCGAHLGHVFDDARDMPTGKRYCINSCALDLEEKDNEK